jgi:dTDP-4-dehydrorhamnose reductase
LSDLILGISPDAVIHCDGLSEGAWAPLTIDASNDAARICSAAQAACRVEAHFTYISTDAIFDRPRFFHSESSCDQSADAPLIRSLESAALEWGGLVLRTHALAWESSVSGDSPSLSEQIQTSLTKQTALAINPARYATPVLVDELAEGWLRSYERKLRGVLHVAGAERVGQLRFAKLLAAELNNTELNDTTRLEDFFALPAESKSDRRETSLCSRQARDLLGWRPSYLADTIKAFAAQRTGRWDAMGRPVDATRTARAA